MELRRQLKKQDQSHKKDIHLNGHHFKYIKCMVFESKTNNGVRERLYIYQCNKCKLVGTKLGKKHPLNVNWVPLSITSAASMTCGEIKLSRLLK